MVTVVESTISLTGTPDYSTLQSWEDASPVDLVADDKVWRGVIQEATDNFSAASDLLTIGGSTVDATRYKELTAASGASFIDGIGSSGLRYNESYGCSLNSSVNFGRTLSVTEEYFKISRIQMKATGTSSRALQATSNFQADKCIFNTLSNVLYSVRVGGSSILSNCLIIQETATATYIIRSDASSEFHNCTIVVPSDKVGSTFCFNDVTTGSTVVNCGIFGIIDVTNNIGTTFTTCFTDSLLPPTGCTTTDYSVSSGAYFYQTISLGSNFKIKTASSLKDSGTTDATYGSVDILDTARPQGVAYDVGCYEFIGVVLVAGSIFNADDVKTFGVANGYGVQYNDILLNWLRAHYLTTGSTLPDLLARWIKENGKDLP